MKLILKLIIQAILTFSIVNYFEFTEGTWSRFLAIFGFAIVVDYVIALAYHNPGAIIIVKGDSSDKDKSSPS